MEAVTFGHVGTLRVNRFERSHDFIVALEGESSQRIAVDFFFLTSACLHMLARTKSEYFTTAESDECFGVDCRAED